MEMLWRSSSDASQLAAHVVGETFREPSPPDLHVERISAATSAVTLNVSRELRRARWTTHCMKRPP
jgi:hypothetical protein